MDSKFLLTLNFSLSSILKDFILFSSAISSEELIVKFKRTREHIFKNTKTQRVRLKTYRIKKINLVHLKHMESEKLSRKRK
jgi:hypothetical protein